MGWVAGETEPLIYFADDQGRLFGRLANGRIAPAEIVDGKPVLKSALASAAFYLTAASPPRLTIVAGANGAGKSTFTSGEFSAAGLPIIDADKIGKDRGISEGKAWELGRDSAYSYLAAGKSFVVETTLSGSSPKKEPTYIQLMRKAREQGYLVELIYIGTASVDVNIAHVAVRAESGGHNIDEATIRRKYENSYLRLPVAIAIATKVILVDNTGESFEFVLEAENGTLRDVKKLPRWVSEALPVQIAAWFKEDRENVVRQAQAVIGDGAEEVAAAQIRGNWTNIVPGLLQSAYALGKRFAIVTNQ